MQWKGVIRPPFLACLLYWPPIAVEGGIDGAILSCHKVLEQKSEKDKNIFSKTFVAGNSFRDIICKSQKMHNIVYLAKLYAGSDFPVIITGETGTERRMLAKASITSEPEAKNLL